MGRVILIGLVIIIAVIIESAQEKQRIQERQLENDENLKIIYRMLDNEEEIDEVKLNQAVKSLRKNGMPLSLSKTIEQGKENFTLNIDLTGQSSYQQPQYQQPLRQPKPPKRKQQSTSSRFTPKPKPQKQQKKRDDRTDNEIIDRDGNREDGSWHAGW